MGATRSGRQGRLPRRSRRGPQDPGAHDITYAQLQRKVVKLANGLRSLGVARGVPVGIYLQMIPEAIVAMLACARLGAPHTVIFGGFSGKAVAERVNHLECTVLITQDEAVRGGKIAAQKTNADEGIDAGPTTIKKIVVVGRTGGNIAINSRDVYYDELVAEQSGDPSSCPCEPMDPEDLLFLLYTSGTTGEVGVCVTCATATAMSCLVFSGKAPSANTARLNASNAAWISGARALRRSESSGVASG